MLKNEEKLQKVLAADDIATQMLTSEDRQSLARFNEELDRLRKEKGIPAHCGEPEEIISEAFRLVPGSERALEEHTKILDNLLKTGSG